MAALDWITLLVLGGLLGALGQGIRIVAGLKKVNDQAFQQGRSFAQLFEASRLVVSLLIGFVAGALAIIASASGPEVLKVSRELAVMLIAAGYAGTDFIEGFVKKYLPPGTGRGTHESPGEMPAVG